MRWLFLLLMIAVFLSVNLYVFLRAWQAIGLNNMIWKIAFIAIAVLLSVSMFVFFMISESVPISVSGFLYRFSTTWFIAFIYFFLFILLRDIILVVDRYTHFIPVSISANPKFYQLSFYVTTGIAVVILLIGFINYNSKKRVELTIDTGKMKESVKMVMVSDLHLGYAIGTGEVDKWVKLINKENPDIVLIAGDLIDNSVRPLNELNFDLHLKNINAPLGVYACPGNHEFISNIQRSAEFMKKSNINFLVDTTVLINNSFYLIGRNDKTDPNRKTIDELAAGLDRSKPVVLLDHQPYNLEETSKNKIDLQLSGHTHKGQVWPITWIINAMYEVPYGFKKKEDTNIYVSSGLGIWGGKFRIGSSSEYAVIYLK
ncbi:MAG: metallophosphoesterase [Bacteroidales bacterium]|nr:metallophosphoesterase [Bacteroidales bacterium]